MDSPLVLPRLSFLSKLNYTLHVRPHLNYFTQNSPGLRTMADAVPDGLYREWSRTSTATKNSTTGAYAASVLGLLECARLRGLVSSDTELCVPSKSVQHLYNVWSNLDQGGFQRFMQQHAGVDLNDLDAMMRTPITNENALNSTLREVQTLRTFENQPLLLLADKLSLRPGGYWFDDDTYYPMDEKGFPLIEKPFSTMLNHENAPAPVSDKNLQNAMDIMGLQGHTQAQQFLEHQAYIQHRNRQLGVGSYDIASCDGGAGGE